MKAITERLIKNDIITALLDLNKSVDEPAGERHEKQK